jgi:hypothetical protein
VPLPRLRVRAARLREAVGPLWIVAVGCAVHAWMYLRSRYVPLTGDMVHYNHAADLLLQRHVLTYWSTAPAAQVMPGYPLFVALCKWLAGHVYPRWGEFGLPGLHMTILVQAALAIVTSLLLYRVAMRLCPPRWAMLAALLWTLYLPQVKAASFVLTETLFNFLFWSFVLSFCRAMERSTLPRWFVAGLLLGLGVLVRPTPLPYLAAIALCLGWRWRTGQATLTETVRRFGGALVGFLLCLAPWWIRNWRTFHRLILTSDDAGNPLLNGVIPDWADWPVPPGLTAQEQVKLALNDMARGFSQHPLAYLKWLTVDKLWRMFGAPWYPDTEPYQWWANLHLLWVGLGAAGLVWATLAARHVRWLLWFPLVLAGLQLPFIPLPRYVFPVMPVAFLGTAVFGYRLTEWMSRRMAPERPWVA